MTLQLSGIFPPVPTPFTAEGGLALPALKENLAHWNRFDLRGYIVLGSNGEFVFLSEQEKLKVLETARTAVPSNKLLIAGTGRQGTQETIELTKKAAASGANAALVLTPSYYKGRMTSEALVRHYHTVADASPIPILIYNMPACTGIDL
ncbi:MAG TPA: dihydrodipicolinate synthase family protein, partial [Candidatus Heimdallarchaeota archaeon]|nr:dihydrodipicolinate synthase family protein [Candidatus Heimdallarchaeota archaeon]